MRLCNRTISSFLLVCQGAPKSCEGKNHKIEDDYARGIKEGCKTSIHMPHRAIANVERARQGSQNMRQLLC